MPSPLTLGILSPLTGNFYFGQLLRGAQHAASQRGARAIAIQTRDAWAPFAEYGRSREFTHQLAWEYVDGWIAITEAAPPTYLHAIKQAGKPLVLVSWRLPEFDCPTVLPDNHGGVKQAVRHLIEHGHTRIAFVGFLEHTDIRERYDGYHAVLVEHGLTPNPELCVATVDNQFIGGQGAAKHLLAAGMPCTAVVAGTDLNALAILATLHSAGLRVPEDVAVVGFDDIDSAQYAMPALTTVRQRFDTAGRTAAELLLAKLMGADVASGFHRVPCTLIVRRSCGCMPTSTALNVGLEAPAAQSWPDWLATELVRLALSPDPVPPGLAAAEIWPGVTTLVQGAVAAIAGTAGPSDQELACAWQEAITLTSDLRVLRAMIARLNELAQPHLPPNDPAARVRLDQFLDIALSDMIHARLRAEIARSAHFEAIILSAYDITASVLASEEHNAHELAWLQLTPATRGCLGLWDSAQTRLTVVGVFHRTGEAPELERSYPPQRFPPLELLQAPVQDVDGEMPMLFPVRTPQRDWGILALVGPIEATLESARSIFSQATATLTIALEREELLRSLVAQQALLREAYDRERIQAATIRAIGAPIIPLLPQVLLIPLIGTIDAARAQQLIETALEGISRAQATEVLLDLTGVPLVDTQVASALIQVTRAAMLLGANVVLVGVSPEIAQSLVSLGIDLSYIDSQPTLAAAIERLLRRAAAPRPPRRVVGG